MSNQSSAGQKAARAASAAVNIARGAAAGGVYGAAVEAAKSFLPELIRLFVILLCVVLLVPMLVFTALPNILFGYSSSTDQEIIDFTASAQELDGIYQNLDNYQQPAVLRLVNSILPRFWSDGEPLYDDYGVDQDLGYMNKYWLMAIGSVRYKQDLYTMDESAIEDMMYDRLTYSTSLIDRILNIFVRDLTPEEYMDKLNFTQEERDWAALLYSMLAEDQNLSYGDSDGDGYYNTDYGDITFSDAETPVVYYNQTDSRWGNKMYGKSGTIGEAGCGPTALAIAVASLTSNQVTPYDVAQWSVENGYRCEGNGSYHSLIPNGGAHYGLTVTGVGNDSKVTYTFLLNRFQLSRLNGWLNDDGEVFIIYTRRSLSSEMQVSYHKIIEAMKELSSAGLIWERRCGRGDANQIYLALVEHRETAGGSAPFVPPEHEAAGGEQPVPAGGSALETGPSGKGRTPPEPHEAQAPPASPRSAGSELLVPAQPEQRGTAAGLEVPGPNFLKSQSGTSRDSETELPEVDQRDSSYIDLNHTDGIHTEFSLSCPSGAGDRMDGLGPWWRNLSEQEQLAQILENCSLWVFDPETAKVFENAIERLFYTQEYRIGKAVLPQANVRSRLWDLDSTILQSVEGKLRQNQRNVKNSTAYTMAVIFNAICESQSDLLLDPYLNSIGGAPAGSEKGGENQCF